jgi:hypothetical protein
MSNTINYEDVVLSGDSGDDLWSIALVHAVAAGKLYIMNGKGEMEQVVMATYWRNHENGFHGICTVTTAGYEFDEDGETTRTFNQGSQDK